MVTLVFMKLRLLIFFFFLGFFTPSVSAFSDVALTDEYVLAIRFLSEVSILNGYPDGTFKPDQPVNRAEALKLILKSAATSPETIPAKPVFSDVYAEDWFFTYVQEAHQLKIVEGDQKGAFFRPARPVNRAEFLKMLFLAHGIKTEPLTPQPTYNDVPKKAWFFAYMNQGAALGLISASHNRLYPGEVLTRGEVSEILYLTTLLKKSSDLDFLLQEAYNAFLQIEVYMQAGGVESAQKASDLAINLATQADRVKPNHPPIQGLLKLIEGYQLLVRAFKAGVEDHPAELKTLCDQAVLTATRAWEIDHDTQPMARQIKDRAWEIVGQVEE